MERLNRRARIRTACLGLPLALGVGSSSCGEAPPNQQPPQHRIDSIARLELQLWGTARLVVAQLDRVPTGGTPAATVTYTLVAPHAPVEDTDIRGFLDGTTMYPFNQGGSYHMRVGRRFASLHRGQFELKRSLVRWALPDLPAAATVTSAEVALWVEAFPTNSPLADPGGFRPLHLMGYPTPTVAWNAGHGGTAHDDFSPAAPGEASWTHSRAGEETWPAPGVLRLGADPSRPYGDLPVAVSRIEGGHRRVILEGERLREYLQAGLHGPRSLALLLKLGDEEEHRVGTEVALLSSDFGDDRDLDSKRPRLRFDVQAGTVTVSRTVNWILEPGMDHTTPVVRHPGGRVLVGFELLPGPPGGAPPTVFVRGASAATDSTAATWERYVNPLIRRWDWSQFRISAAPNRLLWGDTLFLRIRASWVEPGPRERQAPILVLVAPSGGRHSVVGRPQPDLAYQLAFVPREPGLWRYGWSFRPTAATPPGAHEGEGLFYVMTPTGLRGLDALRTYQADLRRLLRHGPYDSPNVQTQLNAFTRWATRHASNVPGDSAEVAGLVEEVRAAVTSAARSSLRGRIQRVRDALRR